MTRTLVREETFPASQEALFTLLHTPSAIRRWWGAECVIVIKGEGGIWAAAWGDEDAPDYVTAATISVFDPPLRMVLSDYLYWARSGPLPFEASFVTEFAVEPRRGGAALRVVQDGFPVTADADTFYGDCQAGWRETFAGIRSYLSVD